jgi:hypothetical protein
MSSNSQNTFISFANNIETLTQNGLNAMNALNEAVNSNLSSIVVTVTDTNGVSSDISIPTLGGLQAQINSIGTTVQSLAGLNSNNAIIKDSTGIDKKIISYDINREPNYISQATIVSNFISNNNFIDTLMNPVLKIQVDLTGKIDDQTTKVRVKKYEILFEKDVYGVLTTNGSSALTLFNNTIKSRTDITESEIEKFISSTVGVSPDDNGNIISTDEEDYQLEYNSLRYEGFYTILKVSEDTVNKTLIYNIDTLSYTDLTDLSTKTLRKGDVLVINNNKPTTRYQISDIITTASEYQVKLQLLEGFDPIPVNILSGMKFYSPIQTTKTLDISIGFDQHLVLFLKPIDTSNNILGRKYSMGFSIYTNDLSLSSNINNLNGMSMTDFYVNHIKDFGSFLKDYTDRYIPLPKAQKPNAPVLDVNNFRVVQSNTFLTDNVSTLTQQKLNQQISELRNKITYTNKAIQTKRDELLGKNFKSSKDKQVVTNQIKQLNDELSSDTDLLSSLVNQLNTSLQSTVSIDPSFEVQGFWGFPAGVSNGTTRLQEVIGFYVEAKYTNADGKETGNVTFKVTDSTGNTTNAVFSPWKPYLSTLRNRVFDTVSQSYTWQIPSLSDIDVPNPNSISIPVDVTEYVTMRVKSISEVGYPDSAVYSDWSNEITIAFPKNLIPVQKPQEIYQKNVDLETVRTKVNADFEAKGLTQHLGDNTIVNNKYYSHTSDSIGCYDNTGRLISLSDKIKSIDNNTPTNTPIPITFMNNWSNYGQGYSSATYYTNASRVYLSGVIRVDTGASNTPATRYPDVDVRLKIASPQYTEYSVLCVLPEGYRPTERKILATITHKRNDPKNPEEMGRIDILTDGSIVLVQGNTSFLSLDGLSFNI